ncbi:hypothetical protein [Frigidibacter sp. SD6-1]|uniref:hypothetical protein n=1 Tax=Frigidibacter sp. SD6-1 TaxID=3032581 RepID=UPI0024DFEE0D|nr:hypothetical protein [Frigidibacter sp. SD6-1]
MKQDEQIRSTRPAVWIAFALAGAVSGLGTTSAIAGSAKGLPPQGSDELVLAAATATQATTGDEIVDLLIALGSIDARLQAGMTLYQYKDRKGAIEHFRIARKDVYSPMAPQLQAKNLPAFDEGIRALEMASSPGQVAGAYLNVVRGLAMARNGLAPSPKQVMSAVEMQTSLAAQSLGKGLKEGQVKNMVHYQNAWGQILSARAVISTLETSSDPAVKPAVTAAASALDDLIIAMPDPVPEGPIDATEEMAVAAVEQIKTAAAALQ